MLPGWGALPSLTSLLLGCDATSGRCYSLDALSELTAVQVSGLFSLYLTGVSVARRSTGVCAQYVGWQARQASSAASQNLVAASAAGVSNEHWCRRFQQMLLPQHLQKSVCLAASRAA